MKRTATLFAAMLLAAMLYHPGTLAAKDDELAAVVRIRSLFPEDAESTVKHGREHAGNEGGVQMTRVVSRKEFAGSWEYYLDNAIFTTPAFADFSGAGLLNRQGQLIGIGYLLTVV
jgi:hypothetical protein